MSASIGKCPTCEGVVSTQAAFCPHCGHPGAQQWRLKTAVADLDMPFGSMIVFALKWAAASLPALVILVWVLGALFALMGGLAMLGR